MSEVEFRVYGKPEPKGSHRPVGSSSRDPRKRGRCICVDTNANALRKWERAIVDAAFVAGIRVEANRFLWIGPVAAFLTFYMPRPESLPLFEGVLLHQKKPDIDKLCRAVLDALSGLVYVDDSQVAAVTAAKYYEVPGDSAGVRVHVRQLT